MNSGKFYSVILLIFVFVLPFATGAQEKYYTKSKKAIKKFESALYQYNLKYFEQAKILLNEAIESDDKFIDAFILFGEIANEENNRLKAINYYKKAISIKEDYKPMAILRLAEIQKSIGLYSDAKNDFLKFASYDKKGKDYSDYVKKQISKCDFAIELQKNPVEFHPVNLGEKINTKNSEYWPSITADDSTLVFTSSDRINNTQEDLFFSNKTKNGWSKANRMPPPVNSDGSEGAQTISADGRTMVFTACLRADGYGSCDLYISKKTGKIWTKPKNMGTYVNSPYKESQPSLSSDGRTIYFASNRPEGKGKFDIWTSNLDSKDEWTIPENLGDSINTPDDEIAPFIHQDNMTLYFSSEGHSGMGGSDVFISRKVVNGYWGSTKNAGYPINTYFNEESLIVNAGGDFGLISSNMDGGYGQKDIYQFTIPDSLKPKKTIYIKGLVYNAKTKVPLQSEINISDFSAGSELSAKTDGETGEFLICLIPGKKYVFNVDKPGYMIYSESLLLTDSNLYIKIPLDPIEIGQSVVLKNIFFDYDSFQLKNESYIELKKLVKFVEENKVIIEIQGHTDNTGNTNYNQKLSENRANAVFDYIISNGIDIKQLKFKGYGSSKPISDNVTDYGRSKNRRTAFVIIGKSH